MNSLLYTNIAVETGDKVVGIKVGAVACCVAFDNATIFCMYILQTLRVLTALQIKDHNN